MELPQIGRQLSDDPAKRYFFFITIGEQRYLVIQQRSPKEEVRISTTMHAITFSEEGIGNSTEELDQLYTKVTQDKPGFTLILTSEADYLAANQGFENYAAYAAHCEQHNARPAEQEAFEYLERQIPHMRALCHVILGLMPDAMCDLLHTTVAQPAQPQQPASANVPNRVTPIAELLEIMKKHEPDSETYLLAKQNIVSQLMVGDTTEGLFELLRDNANPDLLGAIIQMQTSTEYLTGDQIVELCEKHPDLREPAIASGKLDETQIDAVKKMN